MKNWIQFSHQVAYATSLALVSFFLIVHPEGLRIDPWGVLTKLLDLPVAAVGLLLPLSWRGLDLWFHPQEVGDSGVTEVLIRHLRIAIPTYVLVFAIGSAVWGAWRRSRKAA